MIGKSALVNLDINHRLSFVASNDEPSVIFLHGIMGSKRNLHGFMRQFLSDFPHLSAKAFDLRNHGESTKHWAPFTVHATASDIVAACEQLALRPKAIIGHSFGAKVALHAAMSLPSLKQVWLLDCPPGIINADTEPQEDRSLNVLEIIEVLPNLPWPLSSRNELVRLLMERGVNQATALFLTTNLIEDGAGFSLLFDPSEIALMLKDFMAVDGWPLVSALSDRCAIHLVAAERGRRVTTEDENILRHAAKKQGYFHWLTDAGHFVHIDNPKGLLQIMRPFLVEN